MVTDQTGLLAPEPESLIPNPESRIGGPSD